MLRLRHAHHSPICLCCHRIFCAPQDIATLTGPSTIEANVGLDDLVQPCLQLITLEKKKTLNVEGIVDYSNDASHRDEQTNLTLRAVTCRQHFEYQHLSLPRKTNCILVKIDYFRLPSRRPPQQRKACVEEPWCSCVSHHALPDSAHFDVNLHTLTADMQ